MAISKSDCLLLLTELQDTGIDCSSQISSLMSSNELPLSVLEFINNNRQLSLTSFYEKLRHSYNNKKSVLYKKIVSGIPEDKVNDIITTLTSYALQVNLFSKDVKDIPLFFRFARLEEVYKCLYYYSKTYDLKPCIRLMQLIKADIKALETVYRKP